MFLLNKTEVNKTDHHIFLDLTGSNSWKENSTFRNGLKKLAHQQALVYATLDNEEVEEIGNNGTGHRTENGVIKDEWLTVYDVLDTDEAGVIFISNNATNAGKWAVQGTSVVYVDMDRNISELDFNRMPDAIWTVEDFCAFADDPTFHANYKYLQIDRFPLKERFTQLYQIRNIENSNRTAEVIFTGRYFQKGDNRHYIDPLSNAILSWKKPYQGQPQVASKFLGALIDKVVQTDQTVKQVTFVPPRPGKKDRFEYVKEFVTADIPLNYDLLYVNENYNTPKHEQAFEGKHKVVSGKFTAKETVNGHILLVDDVFTSGATTLECARMLYEAGADKVTILPLAFTQNYYGQDQPLPTIFNDDGNEYELKFRTTDHQAFWGSRKNDKSYDSKDYHDLLKEYLSPYGTWSENRIETQTYTADVLYKIRAIIFDFDNTLVKTDHVEAYRKNNSNVPKEKLGKEHLMINPELLRALQDNDIKIGIVTRSPKKYAEYILDAYGFTYDHLVAIYETSRTKPYPDPLIKCAKKMNKNVECILNIGDQQSDIKAGEYAGMMNLPIKTAMEEEVLEKILSANMPLEI